MHFDLLATDGAARRGRLALPRGTIETPAFMPVGTYGSVKAMMPRDLVDGAFLRRIPYKIEVPDPSEQHFRKLFEIMAPKMGMVHNPEAVDYLIETHYKAVDRPYRACQPRDLLLQVRNYCVYKKREKKITPDAFDFAVGNYFAVM